MFELVHSFDADAMYVLNHWLPTSTDVFWLAVTKTITWIPLYVVMVERLFRRSAMDVFVKRLALVVLGVLLGIKALNYSSIGLPALAPVKLWKTFVYWCTAVPMAFLVRMLPMPSGWPFCFGNGCIKVGFQSF